MRRMTLRLKANDIGDSFYDEATLTNTGEVAIDRALGPSAEKLLGQEVLTDFSTNIEPRANVFHVEERVSVSMLA